MKNKLKTVHIEGEEWHYTVKGDGGYYNWVNIYPPNSKTLLKSVPADKINCDGGGVGPGDVKLYIRHNIIGVK